MTQAWMLAMVGNIKKDLTGFIITILGHNDCEEKRLN